MTDKTHEDVVGRISDAILIADTSEPDWRGQLLDKAVAALAALNTRPDVEAGMRERCARAAEELQGRWHWTGAPEAIATAIRQLPLSNEGESRG